MSKIISVSKLLYIALGLFIIFVSFIGCKDNSTSLPSQGFLVGQVTDSLTSAPLDSAAIFPYDTLTVPKYTDSLGNYVLPLIPANNIPIFVLKNGYATLVDSFSIVASESTHADFKMVH